MSFSRIFQHAVNAYSSNAKLISFFSLPFAIVFPLSLLLPNFAAFGGIFLRYGSIREDLSLVEALFIVLVFLISLLLFSFAIVAINRVIKSQRTQSKMKHYELERMETDTFKLFTVFLFVFVISLLANLFLYDMQLNASYGLLFSLALSLATAFVPQAIVIDEMGILKSVRMSLSVLYRRPLHVLGFLCVALVLMLVNSFIFLQFQDVFFYSNYLAVLVNALLIVPFLEVLKTQVYLSKYSLL